MYHDQDRDAMTSLQMHLEPPVSGGPKIRQGWKIVAKESKQVILIHFGHRMTSDKPRWPTQRWRYLQHQILFLARTESKKQLPERSMPPVCHRHTITPSQAQNTEHFNNLGASIGHSNTSTTTGSDKTKIAAH
jgi:hypothetical protein